MKPAVYAKAILAALIALLGTLGTALADDVVSQAEWVSVALSAVVALGGVGLLPNAATADPRESTPDVAVPPFGDRGAVDPVLAGILVVLVLILLVLGGVLSFG